MLAEADAATFRSLVDGQSIRQLKRYLDYGKRARQGAGMAELGQWVGRILLDRDAVYSLEDRARAFEIGACEWLARHWEQVSQPAADVVTVAGDVDKVRLLRLVIGARDPAQQTALASLLAQRYQRTWAWAEERAAQMADGEQGENPAEAGGEEAAEGLFLRFLGTLAEIDPLASADGDGEAERALAEAVEREAHTRRELEIAAERAERAVARLETVQEEVSQLRRTLRDERANGDKLREERSRRIKIEREARTAAQELDRLKTEYVRLDSRLRETAQRHGATAAQLDLSELSGLDPYQLLGLQPPASKEELTKARHRFAAAFHPDRAAQLPDWVGTLFDRLLGIVNAACDRTRPS